MLLRTGMKKQRLMFMDQFKRKMTEFIDIAIVRGAIQLLNEKIDFSLKHNTPLILEINEIRFLRKKLKEINVI